MAKGQMRLDNEVMRSFLGQVLMTEEDQTAFIRRFYGHLDERRIGEGVSKLEAARQQGLISVTSLLLGETATESKRMTLFKLLARKFPQRVEVHQHLLFT